MPGQSRKSVRNEQKLQQKQQGSQMAEGSNPERDKQKIDFSSQGRWTKLEHKRFVEALSLYGKNWKKVEDHVSTRSGAQIRSHAQKFFNRLEREFNQQFNGLKSSEIKTMFENPALHHLSFGERSERRPRSDSVNTNLSLDLVSDEEPQNQERPEEQPTHPSLEELQSISDLQTTLSDLFNQPNAVIMQQLLADLNIAKLWQFLSAYQYIKEGGMLQEHEHQESVSFQERSSLQEPNKKPNESEEEDLEAPRPLRKKYSTEKIGQDESFFHFIIDKYYKYFNHQPTLIELADVSIKKTEKSSLADHQPRSRRGSFVFCNEDEEDNETRYQQLKKVKGNKDDVLNQGPTDRKNTN